MVLTYPVAVDTVDIIIGSICKIGSVQLVFTFNASKTLFMKTASLSNLLLSIKNHSIASRTCIGISFLSRDRCYIGNIQIRLGFVPKHMRMTQFAINIRIRAFSTKLIIQGTFAVATRETLLMIKPIFGRHFFRFKNLRKESFRDSFWFLK